MNAVLRRRQTRPAAALSESGLVTYSQRVGYQPEGPQSVQVLLDTYTNVGAATLVPPSACQITQPAAGTTTAAINQTITLAVSCSGGSAPLIYSWARGNSSVSSAPSFNDTPFADSAMFSVTYSVTVSNSAGSVPLAKTLINSGYVGAIPKSASSTLTFIHPHITGSPLMATDINGNVVWREDYSAFGERRKNEAAANSGGANNQHWFIGKPQDSATGLVYFGARWYDPQVGRFLGVDPAGVDEHNPHSFNRYSYGNNNPNKFLDPDGRIAFLIPLVAAAIEFAPAISVAIGVGYSAGRAASAIQRAVAALTPLANNPAVVNGVDAASGLIPGASPVALAPAGSSAQVVVGRSMSKAEHDAMIVTNKVQESYSGTTHVAAPAAANVFSSKAKKGSVYVEFSVPSNAIKPTSENGVAKIVGPKSLEGRAAERAGRPIPQMPEASNISIQGVKGD